MRKISSFMLALFLLSFIQAYSAILSQEFPVELSFIIVDLKYNQEKGVQICEIQQGAVSKFMGYDFLFGKKGLVAEKFSHALSKYSASVWYYPADFADPVFKEVFQLNGYTKVIDLNKLKKDKDFKKASQARPYDPHDIENYGGVYMGRITQLAGSLEDFRKKFPGIVPLDAAFLRFRANKLAMNELLTSDEALKVFKPKCGSFKKKSPNLQKEIVGSIPGDVFVIKPIGTYKGNGVVIVPKEELHDTLSYIFSGSSELRKDPDPSYRWWAKDTSSKFLVEEFVPSDPVIVPHLHFLPYDGTMRVVCLLAYTGLEINIHFIESHWKLPRKPLTAEGSWNDKHKSFAEEPNYAKVSDEMNDTVEAELGACLRALYTKILLSD